MDSEGDDEIFEISADEQSETEELDRKVEELFLNKPFSVNNTLAEIVLKALKEMGIKEPKDYVAIWSPYRFQAIANYSEACEDYNLPCVWGEEQVGMFLKRLHEKNYAVATLASQWTTVVKVGKTLGHEPTQKMHLRFLAVKNEGKAMKDNKLPVSKKLLLQLVAATDIVLKGYTSLLAKTMFLNAWAFSMRISEFSETRSKTLGLKAEHNVCSNVVTTSDIGLSAAFESDKTSKFSTAIRHRTVKWHKLPDYTRAVVDEYIAKRPDSEFFFTRKDGQPLTHDTVLNLLDVCLLQTEWAHLKITPHCFRQGMCSEDALEEKVGPDRIKYNARWSRKNDADEAYMRSDLVGISPLEIFKRDTKYHRIWSADRLKFLARNIVETPGMAPYHPHHIVVELEFPDEFIKIRHAMPKEYPHKRNIKSLGMKKTEQNQGYT